MSTEKLLKEFGISEDVAASLSEEKLDEVKSQIVQSVKTKLLEDEEFYRSIDKEKLPREFFKEKFDEGISKISATSKAAIDKHFALTESEKEGFTEEEKKDVTKYIAKAASIYKEKTSSSKDLSALQDENLTLKQQLEERQKEIASINEKFDSELKEKLTAKETETLSMIEAASLQENIPVSISLIWDKIYGQINQKYSVILENGKTSIRKKDNINFKVDKADKSGHMNLKDALIEELKAVGAWKEEASIPDNKKITVDVQPNKGVLSDAIKKKIQEEERFFS